MMKKIICLILAMLMLLSVASCGTTPSDSEKGSESQGVSDGNATDGDKGGSAESDNSNGGSVIPADKYDGVFKVGYSRVDITPEMLPIPRKNNKSTITYVEDPIYATCIAFNDGKTTALVFTVDICNVGEEQCNAIKVKVQRETKVPFENIFIHATHDHSTPTLANPNNNTAVMKWTSLVQTKMAEAAAAAVADLTDAKMYGGVGDTPSMAFVRRYLLEDGTYSGVNSPMASSAKPVSHVSEADDTVQVLRFVRDNKKDVVAINWQCHLASAVELMPKALTADIAYYVRRDVEAGDDDTLVAYFAGASGNIGSCNSPVVGLKKYRNYQYAAQALAEVILGVLKSDKLEKIEAGKITTSSKVYDSLMWKDSASRIAQANEVLALTEGSKEQDALLKKYGWQSLYGPKSVVSRNNSKNTTISVPMGALSFGDFALITAPYEMFDNNGVQIKEGSPFKTTFILTNAGGALAYVASIEAYTTYGGYEVENTQFAAGEGEKMVEEYIKMLNAHKK